MCPTTNPSPASPTPSPSDVARLLPCWVVDVRHERNNGRLGHFTSTPMTLTAARRLLAEYHATGTPAAIECLEDLATLHRAMIAGQLSYDEALDEAERLGYAIGVN